MGLVKTRRLAAMQKQQRAIHLRQGYGWIKGRDEAANEGRCRDEIDEEGS